MRLIDADALTRSMYLEAFESDSDRQRWDSGCWIRYKMFEDHRDAQPTVDAIPVEWIEGERQRLVKQRIDCDSDDVDTAWDLKMKIEAIEDLLEAWKERDEG